MWRQVTPFAISLTVERPTPNAAATLRSEPPSANSLLTSRTSCSDSFVLVILWTWGARSAGTARGSRKTTGRGEAGTERVLRRSAGKRAGSRCPPRGREDVGEEMPELLFAEDEEFALLQEPLKFGQQQAARGDDGGRKLPDLPVEQPVADVERQLGSGEINLGRCGTKC